MKKIMLLIILLCMPVVVNASGFYEDITILENGDLHVKQSIVMDGEYNGFNLKIGISHANPFPSSISRDHMIGVIQIPICRKMLTIWDKSRKKMTTALVQ